MHRVLHTPQNWLAVKATVVMPTTTPLIKVNRTKGYGAEVVLHGDVFDEALRICI